MHRLAAATWRPLTALVLLIAGMALTSPVSAQQSGGARAVATFAGGCFWCVESDFDKVPGVLATVSGYMGGKTKNPTYKQVSEGGTGHKEVVQITYDPQKVTYQRLLEVFWRTVDPVDAGGQFCDRGDQYGTAIFAHTDEQRLLAEASKAMLQKSARFKQPIATAILPASDFTRAEDYHQDYYVKNPLRYAYYRSSCGRDRRVKELWGDEAGGKAVTQ